MALASLCSRLQKARPGQYEFRAVVIDHKAREGSSDEAKIIVRRLRKMGKLSHDTPTADQPTRISADELLGPR